MRKNKITYNSDSHLFHNNLLFENHHYNRTRQGKIIELLLENSLESELGKPIRCIFRSNVGQ